MNYDFFSCILMNKLDFNIVKTLVELSRKADTKGRRKMFNDMKEKFIKREVKKP